MAERFTHRVKVRQAGVVFNRAVAGAAPIVPIPLRNSQPLQRQRIGLGFLNLLYFRSNNTFRKNKPLSRMNTG